MSKLAPAEVIRRAEVAQRVLDFLKYSCVNRTKSEVQEALGLTFTDTEIAFIALIKAKGIRSVVRGGGRVGLYQAVSVGAE